VKEAAHRPTGRVFLTAQDVAPMRTGIQKYPKVSGVVPTEDEWSTADGPCPRVVRAGQLGLMTDIEPASIEDASVLLIEHRLIGHRVPIDQKPALGSIVNEKLRSHLRSARLAR
jgi:hypothetical protein